MRRTISLLLILITFAVSACTTISRYDPFNAFYDELPSFTEESCVIVNNGIPFFTEDEITTDVFESYSELDALGRCGVAFANICPDLMPTEERGSIGAIKPSGWHTVKYDVIGDRYLYNRCHLIGYQLAGENANEKNLITGTRYLNVTGMLPWENIVAEYVQKTANHVLYRVTPCFEGNDLVASGVLMEAYSVEDNGAGVCFCVYCYNVQPGIVIDYATGDSYPDPTYAETAPDTAPDTAPGAAPDTAPGSAPDAAPDTDEKSEGGGQNSFEAAETETTADDKETIAPDPDFDYVLNTNTMKFHFPSCSSVQEMSPKNKEYYTGDREFLIEQGYVPCKRCNP